MGYGIQDCHISFDTASGEMRVDIAANLKSYRLDQIIVVNVWKQ